MAAEGLVTRPSAYPVAEALDRLRASLSARGITEFAVVDHAAGASEAGLALRPTTVVIFGNARGGTPLMQAVQTVGLDLPLRMLLWEDASGQAWVTYTDPAWLVSRHGIDPALPAVAALAAALAGLAAGIGG